MRIKEYSAVQKLVKNLFSAGSLVDHYEENFSNLMGFIAEQPEITSILEKHGANPKDLERIYGFLLIELFQRRKLRGKYLPIEALITLEVLEPLLTCPMLEYPIAEQVYDYFATRLVVIAS